MNHFKRVFRNYYPRLTMAAGYVWLEPGVVGQPANTQADLKTFLFGLFSQALIVAAVLAVIMIVYAGILYITSRGGGGITKAKEKLYSAIIGLVLALVAYALLAVVNPQLVDYDEILVPPQSQQP